MVIPVFQFLWNCSGAAQSFLITGRWGGTLVTAILLPSRLVTDYKTDGNGFPLIPEPLLTGGQSDRPLSAGEVRKWAVELCCQEMKALLLIFCGLGRGRS